jgi:hypothetical protein
MEFHRFDGIERNTHSTTGLELRHFLPFHDESTQNPVPYNILNLSMTVKTDLATSRPSSPMAAAKQGYVSSRVPTFSARYPCRTRNLPRYSAG